MRIAKLMTLLAAMFMLSGCVSLRLGTGTEMPVFAPTAGNIYADYTGIPGYNGTLFHGSILGGGSADPGELLGFHIWPLGGFDLGLVGARVKVLGAEAGVGTLFYAPGTMKEEFE